MTTTYADIPALPTQWLWQDRLPRGDVSLLAAPGGTGKGMLLCDLAARVTTGRPMPGETAPSEPGSVILIAPEDDPSETVAWRLRAAEANLSRVHDLTLLDSGSPFELSASPLREGNVAQLREAIDQISDARLVVIDPLMAAIAAGSVATNLGARRVLAPLQRLAKETGVTIVVSHHTVKSGAIAGSKGLIDAARVVYRVSRDAENPAVRVIALEKSNVLGAAGDLRYTLAGDGHGTRVVWLSRDELAARRTSWRDRFNRPPAAKVTPAQAKAAGCRHSSTKFGTLAQCGDCPAGRLAAVSAPAPAGISAPLVAETPGVTYVATASAGGRRDLLGKFASQAAARQACLDRARAAGIGAIPWQSYGERTVTAAVQAGDQVHTYSVARAG
jgi:hypothetical protein